MLITLYLPLLTADLPQAEHTFAAMQLQSMYHFIAPTDYTSRKALQAHAGHPFLFYLRSSKRALPDDPCTWRCCKCTNGALTWFRSLGMDSNILQTHVSAQLHWLVPTVRAVSLQGIALRGGWSGQTLPRDMRFLLLLSCDWCNSAGNTIHQELSLRNLPSKMEELHVRSIFCTGKVSIPDLPSTMHMLVLIGNIEHAFVHADGLPSGLQLLQISRNNKGENFQKGKTEWTRSKPVTIHWDRRGVKDDRVTAKPVSQRTVRGMTKHLQMFP